MYSQPLNKDKGEQYINNFDFEDFAAVCHYALGEAWMSKLSEVINLRTIKRWKSAQQAIPPDLISKMIELVALKDISLMEMDKIASSRLPNNELVFLLAGGERNWSEEVDDMIAKIIGKLASKK